MIDVIGIIICAIIGVGVISLFLLIMAAVLLNMDDRDYCVLLDSVCRHPELDCRDCPEAKEEMEE